jgi:hypothetical protein
LVESLETRELMAANFTLADTLIAKDNITLAAISVKQGIEQLRIDNLTQLGTTVVDAQNQTVAIATDYQAWKAEEAASRAAGDRAGVAFARQQQKIDLAIGAQIRNWLRQATASSHIVQGQLLKDEASVNRATNVAVNNLKRHANPIVVQNQAFNALNRIGANAQQHANSGANTLAVLDNKILGAFTPPLIPIIGGDSGDFIS